MKLMQMSEKREAEGDGGPNKGAGGGWGGGEQAHSHHDAPWPIQPLDQMLPFSLCSVFHYFCAHKSQKKKKIWQIMF